MRKYFSRPWWAPTRHADRRPALVARGADPALSDDRGKTALDIARIQQLKDVVAYLETVTPAK